MKKTIIIASASSGWGHVQAANNIDKALSSLGQGWHIEDVNIFDYLPSAIRLVFNDGWRIASKHSDWFYNEFYRYSVSKRSVRQLTEKLVGSAVQRLARNFEHSEVSVFIATHSIAAMVGSLLKPYLEYKLCVAATDFVLHPMQVFPNVDFFYLPPVYHKVVTAQYDLECIDKKIQHTGIPIAPEFALYKDKEVLRKQFGLSANLYTVLFSFGGTGLRADKHINLFENLLKLDLPLQFLVLAGQNYHFAEAMRNKYENSKFKDRVKVYNYLGDVSDFYAAADLFIGKAGGLTLSEALASGLPIIIIDALPGQEAFNVEVLSSNNLGHSIGCLSDLAELISSFLSGRLGSSLRNDLHFLARPHSSLDVAKHIMCLTN
jgi:processive 1,2-diacylglycerol beta-glucosyltransferase